MHTPFDIAFADEQACRDAFAAVRWAHGFVCPACGHVQRYFAESEGELPGACPSCGGALRSRCPSCGAVFTLAD